MINFIKNIFKKNNEEVEETKSFDPVLSAAISLMVEVSLADNIMDSTEINQLKKSTQKLRDELETILKKLK